MAKILSDNAVAVIKYLREHQTEVVSAADISAALGVSSPKINGCITALSKDTRFHKPLAERYSVDGDDKKKTRLTAEGLAFDLDAERPESE